MLLGADATEKLNKAHVAVFGLGGVGSWCAEALARSGVGELTLVDSDTIAESNINRQLCALSSTIGRAKTELMAERIRDINPDIVLQPIKGLYEAENREAFWGPYDYVADAIDLVSCKLDLIISCRDRGIPIISALGTGNKLDPALLRITDISETSGCPLARVIRRELRVRGLTHLDVVFSPEEAIKPLELDSPAPGRRSVPGSMIFVPASAGLLMAKHIVMSLVN